MYLQRLELSFTYTKISSTLFSNFDFSNKKIVSLNHEENKNFIHQERKTSTE